MEQERRHTSELEHQYAEFFRAVPDWRDPAGNGSLEQPSPLKVVPSVVTYGAYEQPIPGGPGGSSDAELE